VVNLPYRSYTVTDHFSQERPYYGGLDDKLPRDKYQDWVVNKEGSYSDCPGFPEKCIFICNIAREFTTGWADDYDMTLAGPLSLNVAYMVYDAGAIIQSGASQNDDWYVPGMATHLLGVSSFLSVLLATLL
jgi:hypothetical protein